MILALGQGRIRRERVTWAKIRAAGIVVKESTKLADPGRQLTEKLLTRRRQDSNNGEKIPAVRTSRVTFSELCDAVVNHVEAHNRGIATDKSHIGKLKEKFGHYSAESIPPAEIMEWLDGHADWSPATRNRYRASLSLIFKLAIKDRKVKENPAKLLDHHKEGRGRIHFLNQFSPLPTETDYLKHCNDDESRLRAVIATNYAWHIPEFLVSLNCGLRPSELYELTWDKVDFTRRQIFIERSKSGQSRHIPLNAEALDTFKTLHARLIRKKPVFLSNDGAPLMGYKHWFNDAVTEAGLADFTWYCLRHTFASRLVMAGVDIRTVAELMGHQTIQMTMRYAHLAAKHTHAAADRLMTTDFSGPAHSGTTTDTSTPAAEEAESKTLLIQ